MRNHYRSKHDRMLELLKPLEGKFDIRGQGAGLHLVLHLKNPDACLDAAGEREEIEKKEIGDQKRSGAEIEKKLADAARAQRVIVYPLSEQNLPENPSSRRQASPAILLGYAALTEEEIREGTQKLIQAWS